LSIQFNDIENKRGILQHIERNCGFEDGGITGNTKLKKWFTSEVNLALDEVLSNIFEVDGTWQFDDSNFEDFPTITTDLVAGQRDYNFTTDETGNLILDVYSVFALKSATDTKFELLQPIDRQSDKGTDGYWDGQEKQGVPTSYDKTGNGILLDLVPDFSVANGLKIYINREGSYFSDNDTTKKAGFSGLYHEYLALRPAYNYARINSLPYTEQLKRDMREIMEKLRDSYSRREKDKRHVMRPKKINYI